MILIDLSTSPTSRFYLRFVRDRMLYLDSIWCAAARVIALLQRDAGALGIKSMGPNRQSVTENLLVILIPVLMTKSAPVTKYHFLPS